MSTYIVDTVAFIKYLADELPEKADKIFRDAERGSSLLLLPHIVIGEFAYISLKNKIETEDPKASIGEVLHLVYSSSYFRCVDMDLECWEEFLKLNILELHDRMICSIARAKKATVITSDESILKHKEVESVWD